MATMVRGLSPAQLAEFHREGYLVVNDLFSDADLQPVIDEINAEIDVRARELVAAGELSRTYAEEGFETRLTRIMAETDKLYWAICSGQLCGPAIFGLITHPKLVDVIESLVGAEIIGSSVYRLRPKVPGFYHGVVPWHQDSGYFEEYCDKSLIVTVWLPLVDATVERGCLQVIPRAHRGEVVRHVRDATSKYLEILPDALPQGDVVTVPVRKGSALLLTNRTPHRSTDNVTDVIRWSMDIRYQSADLPTNYRLSDGNLFRDLHHDDEPPACYPPEADFLVRSQQRAQDVTRDWRQFEALRKNHLAGPSPTKKRWG